MNYITDLFTVSVFYLSCMSFTNRIEPDDADLTRIS